MINVCIGILARNEAGSIGALIADLAKQTLLTLPELSCQIFVVANGCTDQTSAVARDAFALEFSRLGDAPCHVHEISRAGKSNAWNVFVHEIVPDDAEFLIFLDGDIRIPKEDTLELVVRELLHSETAVVAIDKSVKDLSLESAANLGEWLIQKGTGTANDPRSAIAGALYCVRFAAVRPIWMPIGLPGEDGFLRAMLLTSSFSHPERLDHIVFTEGAFHIFESLRDVKSVVAHNVRLAIGTAMNILLFGHLRRVRAGGTELGDYVRTRNRADPNWINELVQERLRTTYFPLEKRFMLRRLRRIARSPIRAWPKALPLALLGTCLDVVVFVKATALMRRGAGAGFW